jgi:hypothetical protein
VEAEDRDGAVVGAVEIQSWFPRLGVDSCVSSAPWARPPRLVFGLVRGVWWRVSLLGPSPLCCRGQWPADTWV